MCGASRSYNAAGSWSRVERIIARIKAGPEATDTRFIVTNLQGGPPKATPKETLKNPAAGAGIG
jgi:hypothetical protein